jgi:hypothetical protein
MLIDFSEDCSLCLYPLLLSLILKWNPYSGVYYSFIVLPPSVRFCCHSYTSARHLKGLGSDAGRNRLHLSLTVKLLRKIHCNKFCIVPWIVV